MIERLDALVGATSNRRVPKRTLGRQLSGFRVPTLLAAWIVLAGFLLFPGAASASCFPVFGTWPQPGGPGSPMALSYSYINL
ncbi:MAG: hypothetical protein AAGC67_18770, partial [Myxococcota bacterium]